MARPYVLLGAVVVVAGCSTVPPPVVSPVARAPRGTAITWSGDWGFASAHIQRPDGTIQAISANGDNNFGSTTSDSTTNLGLIIPAIVSFHQFNGDWDFGEYVGWRRFGMISRRRLATNAGGAATSIIATVNAHLSFNGLDGGLALEQTIPLSPAVTLLLRAGASWGLRAYDLAMPEDLQTRGDGLYFGGARFDILRTDARVEPTLGLVLDGGAFVISVQPYFVVAHGTIIQADCQQCIDGVKLLDFTQNRGIAAALTFLEP